MLNLHNCHRYAEQNPFVTRNSPFQMQSGLKVWLEVVGDSLIGPQMFRSYLTSITSLEFLKHHLSGLLHVFPGPQGSEIIFQYDRFPALSSNAVRDFQTEQCLRWNNRSRPIPWTFGSLDLLEERSIDRQPLQVKI